MMNRYVSGFVVAVGLAGAPLLWAQADSELIAEAGFNDQVGLYASSAPGSPYTLGATVYERGEGEFGWAEGWNVSAGGAGGGFGAQRATADGEETLEGDGALAISPGSQSTPETWVYRGWSRALSVPFRLDQYVNLPPNGDVGSRPFLSPGTGGLPSRIGPSWGASDGRFHVYDGDGGGGATKRVTPFTWVPGSWYKVSLIVDPQTQTFEFFVDDQKYESGDPLNFRGNPGSINHSSFLTRSGLRIDAIRVTSPPETSTDRPFRRGDATGDGQVDIADAIRTLGVLFLGAGELGCHDAGDVNDDGMVEISDVIGLLNFLFRGGLAPPPPTEACGRDPERDELTCESQPACE